MSKKTSYVIEYGNPYASKYIAGKFDLIEFFSMRTVNQSRKYGTHDTICTYEDDSVWGMGGYGCMANISCFPMHGEGKKVKSISSSLWCHDYKDIDDHVRFWNFILDEEKSPWRCVLKGREVHYAWHEGLKKDVPIAYTLNDMAAPFQVIANLMFTGRMPFAQDGFLKSFTTFAQAGFSLHEALYIAANAAIDHKGHMQFPYIGDYPFDTAWDDVHFKNFVNGTPKFNPTKTVDKGNYAPCNVIWTADPNRTHSGSNYDTANRKATILQKLVSEKGVYKGFFKKAAEGATAKDLSGIHFEKAIEVLKKTRDQWQVPA